MNIFQFFNTPITAKQATRGLEDIVSKLKGALNYQSNLFTYSQQQAYKYKVDQHAAQAEVEEINKSLKEVRSLIPKK